MDNVETNDSRKSWPEWLSYVIFAMLVVLLIVSLTGLAIWSEAQRYRERAVQFTQSTSNLVAEGIYNTLDKTDIILRSAGFQYTEAIAHKHADAAYVNTILERHKSMIGVINDLRLLDEEGIVRYGTGKIEPISLADRDFFKRARALTADQAVSQIVLDGPIFARISKKWVMVLARRINHPDGSFAGVLYANFATDIFGSFMAKVDVGHSGAIVLRTEDMAQIDRYPEVPGSDTSVGNRKVSQNLLDWIQRSPESGSYLATSPLDQIERHYSYKKIIGFPLYVIVGRSTSDFLAEWRSNAYLLIGFSSLMVLATLIAAWQMYRMSRQRTISENQRQSAAILAATPVATLLVNDRGVIERVNSAASEMLGYTPDELAGHPVEDLIPERLRANHPLYPSNFMRRPSASMMGSDTDLQIFHRDGHEIPAQIAVAQINLGGRYQAIVAIEDMSIRRHAEQQWRDLLILQTAILEHATYAIITTDPQGTITLFNKSAERMLGYSAEELAGHATPLIFHDPESLRQQVREQMSAEAEPTFEMLIAPCRKGLDIDDESLYRRKDGKLVPVHRSVVALRAGSGDITGYFASITDISKRRAYDKQMLSTLGRLRLATEAADIGIWTWNFADDKLEWDDRLYKWYDIPASVRERGISYADWRARVHPDDIERTEALLIQSRRDEQPESDVFRVVHADGSIHTIHVAWMFDRDNDGKAIGMVGVNRDITAERVNAEKLATAKREAEAANEAKSNFLSTMSHEIRTPLNAIIGTTYLLGMSPLDESQKRDLDTIRVAGEGLLVLINDILDLAKIEAGELTIDPHPFELGKLIAEVGAIFNNIAKGKGLVLDIPDLSGGMFYQLHADGHRLRQMLVNLLSNAIKFTEKGRVGLDIEVVERNVAQNSVRLRFTVSDTGIGISREHQEHLFQPFSQVGDSTNRRFGGTGLGLSIVKRLATLMGGEVGFASQPSEGSNFWIELPFGIVQAEATVSSPRSNQATGIQRALTGMRILVVDDIPVNLEVIQRILQNKGAVAIACGSGEAALNSLQREGDTIDAVLMDLQMPDMDGVETTSRIRTQLGMTALPVIALTAGATTSEQQRATDAGMNGFLTKPVEPEQLVSVLCEHVEHFRAQEDATPWAESTPPPPDTTNPDWPQIEGIDAEAACRLFADDADFFKTLLGQFVEANASAVDQTQALVEVGDFGNAARLVHKLRGQASNLGAMALAHSAGQLEDALTAGCPDLTSLLPAFEQFATIAETLFDAIRQSTTNHRQS